MALQFAIRGGEAAVYQSGLLCIPEISDTN